MNQGKYVFSQLMSLVNPKDFARCVGKFQGNHRVRTFSCLIVFSGDFTPFGACAPLPPVSAQAVASF
jgi:hypothetical protein